MTCEQIQKTTSEFYKFSWPYKFQHWQRPLKSSFAQSTPFPDNTSEAWTYLKWLTQGQQLVRGRGRRSASPDFSSSIWQMASVSWLEMFLLFSCSFMSNSLQPHKLQPAKLLRPRDPPGKNTGVGRHFLSSQSRDRSCVSCKSHALQADSLLVNHLEAWVYANLMWCFLICRTGEFIFSEIIMATVPAKCY